jgi:hypothetical protein
MNDIEFKGNTVHLSKNVTKAVIPEALLIGNPASK